MYGAAKALPSLWRALPPVAMGMTAYDVANIIKDSARPAPANDSFAEQYARTHPRFGAKAIKTERMLAR